MAATNETFQIKLTKAPEDTDPRDRQWQRELSAFAESLRHAGIPCHQRAFTMDSVDVLGYPLPVFLAAMAPYSHDLATSLTALVEAWIKSRPGRGFELHEGDFHLKVDDVRDGPKVMALVAAIRDAREG